MNDENKQIKNPNLEFLEKNTESFDEIDDEIDLPETKKGTNPLLWNAPTYAAAGDIKKTGYTINPNELLERSLQE